MSPAITLSVHFWRGIGPDVQLSLFYVGFRFGFFTISAERDWWLPAYRRLRDTAIDVVTRNQEPPEGR